MDQIKIGKFLQELRREKGLTPDQLAEKFNVSRRSVSRWETGSNLPDLDVLIGMSEYCGVGLRELLDGERKDEKMDRDLEETVLKVADYSSEEKQKLTRRMHWLYLGGLAAAVLYVVLYFTGREENFLGGLCLGITSGMMIVGVLMTSRYAAKIRAFKAKLLHRR